MTDTNFVVKNGLTANGSFTANNTIVNANNLNVSLQTNTGTLNVSSSANIAGVVANSSGVLTSGSVNAGSLGISGSATISGSLTVSGNLVIAGSTTVVNSTIITTTDKNIVLANGAVSSPVADGAGIEVATFANLVYKDSTTSWQSNVGISPSSNANLSLGTAGLQWANVFVNNVYSNNITGTLQTASQPNITANNSTNFGGLSLASLQGQITGNSATAYANAITSSIATFLPIINPSAAGNLVVSNTISANNANISGNYSANGVVVMGLANNVPLFTGRLNRTGANAVTISQAPSSFGTWNSPNTAFTGDISKMSLGIQHGFSGNVLGTPSTGYLYTPEAYPVVLYGINYANSGHSQNIANNDGRTAAVVMRIKIDNYGQGDAVAYNFSAYVNNTNTSITDVLAGPAVSGINGDVSATGDGGYANPAEWSITDNGYDIAAAGLVYNLKRTNNTANKNAFWNGVRSQSVGTAPIDSHFLAVGKANIGVDLTGGIYNTTGSFTQAAIVMPASGRIYGSGVYGVGGKYVATSTGNDYIERSINGYWNFVYNSKDVIHLSDTNVTINEQTYVYANSSGLTDNGFVIFQDSSLNGLSIGYDTTNNWSWIYSRTAGNIARNLNINNTLFVQPAAVNSYVGIGTSSPSYPLDVSANQNNFSGYIRVTNANTGPSAGGGFTATTGPVTWVSTVTTGQVFTGTSSNHPLNLMANNSTALTISANGNIGVGTTTPAVNLDVFGPNATTRVQGSSNTASYSLIQSYGNSASLYLTSGKTWAMYSDTGGNFPFFEYDGVNSYERMRFASNGNLGIGTTNPQYTLDIFGTARIPTLVTDANTSGGLGYNVWLNNSANAASFSLKVGNGQFAIGDETNHAYRLIIDSAGNANFSANVNTTGVGNFGKVSTRPYANNIDALTVGTSDYAKYFTIKPEYSANTVLLGYWNTGTSSFVNMYLASANTTLAGNAIVIGSFSASTISGNVISTGTSNSRALADRFADVINVLDMGTNVGTGTASIDVAAFNAAITLANANAGNSRKIYVPGGRTYNINAVLNTIVADGVMFVGDGISSTKVNLAGTHSNGTLPAPPDAIFSWTGGTAGVITGGATARGNNVRCRGGGFEGISFYCNGMSGGALMSLDYTWDFSLTNVYAEFTPAIAWMRQASRTVWTNCHFESVTGTGNFSVNDGGYGVYWFGSYTSRNGETNDHSDDFALSSVLMAAYNGSIPTYGQYIYPNLLWLDSSVATMQFSKLQLLGGSRGIYVTNSFGLSFGQYASFITGHDLEIENAYTNGIDIDYLEGFWCHGVYLGSTGLVNPQNQALFGSHVFNVKMTNGKAQSALYHGLSFNGTNSVTLTGMEVYGNSLVGLGQNAGIYIPGVTNFTMSGGSSGKAIYAPLSYTEYQSFGVDFGAGVGATNVSLIGVNLQGNHVQALYNQGSAQVFACWT